MKLPAWMGFRRRAAQEREDLPFMSPVHAAQVLEPAPLAMWAVYLLLAVIVTAVVWAALAKIEIIAKAPARVVPEGREQVIASLEGGILRQMMVREGDMVQPGQAVALLDPTRFEAQQAEGQTRRLALLAALARLEAEAAGRSPQFSAELPESVVRPERESHQARMRSLQEGVETHRRSMALLQRELDVANRLSSQGLMSEVEVMRLRRQVNDLQMGVQERVNRFRQEASADLVRLRNELALVDDQMVVREDALKRTTLVSPVRGLVKQVRANTVGGVVGPGAPLLEIVPVGDRLLIEARVRPADIGFVKTGQPVTIKLTAYEYIVYGALKGTVEVLSPDALGDPERAGAAGGTWYRALVRADTPTLRVGERELTVLPGMQGTAEIRIGERTVLGFLLRPMLRAREAFRER